MTREPVRVVLCDLDGVIWLSGRPIAGAVDAVGDLRRAGARVLFVTNNSTANVADQEAALARIGIDATGDVLTSSGAAALLVAPGQRALVCGETGIIEALAARGIEAVDAGDPSLDRPGAVAALDVVVVGQHRGVTWDHLRRSAGAIIAGADFVATNDDPTFPTPAGPVPGAGAIVAAVAAASGTAPTIAGKPYSPMAELVRSTLGERYAPETIVMVGDRMSTDGAFARTIGCRFVLVRTGVTPPGVPVPAGPVEPWLDVADLATAVNDLLAEGLVQQG